MLLIHTCSFIRRRQIYHITIPSILAILYQTLKICDLSNVYLGNKLKMTMPFGPQRLASYHRRKNIYMMLKLFLLSHVFCQEDEVPALPPEGNKKEIIGNDP